MNRGTGSASILLLLVFIAPLNLSADTLVLKNGNRFEGTIAEKTPEKIVLEIEHGTMEFKSSDVQEIRREKKRPARKPFDGAPAPPSLEEPKPAPEPPGKAKPVPKPASIPASPNVWLPIYNEAKQAVMAGDLEKAKTSLEKVTVLNPDLLEGWYHLGACESRLAIQAAQEGRDQEALALFRSAIAHKKTAKKLMDKGSFVQAQARSDLENALKDVDAFINDDTVVLTALRRYGGMQKEAARHTHSQPRQQSVERYYKDSKGVVMSESETEGQLRRIRDNIRSMPDNLEKAYYEGMLRAVEQEWARIKQQRPISK